MRMLFNWAIIFCYIMLMAYLTGCAGANKVVSTEHGKAITVSSLDSVLVVLDAHKEAEKTVITNEDGYTIFIVPRVNTVQSKPVIITAEDKAQIEILINQYTSDGWTLQGGVSVSTSSFGKTRYHATLVR